MHKVLRIFSATWSETLTYRTDVLIWTLAEAMVPLVAMAIWFTVASSGGLALSAKEAVTYYILIFFVRAATSAWVSVFLTQQILTGSLVQYLTRPISVFWGHIAENLTVKLLRLVLPILFFIVVLITNPALFELGELSLIRGILFGISLLLAAILSFTFDAIFALLAFWLEDSFQIAQFQEMFREVATGVLIPFAVMPPLIFNALAWLPFRYMVSVPVEILLQQETGSGLVTLFSVQIGWLIVSFTMVVGLWKLGLRNYAVPGQ